MRVSRLIAAFLATFGLSCAARAQEAQPNRVVVEYAAPDDPAHAPLVEAMKRRRLLENVRNVLSPLRLPRPLTIRAAGCDGESNAWFDGASVTICYELVDWIARVAEKTVRREGLGEDAALTGPFYNIVFHETAHAVFDYLQTPILGREEDAADQIAALLLMALAPDDADKLVAAVSALYLDEAGYKSLKQLGRKRLRFRDATGFAAEHGAPEQRLYNLLCLAFGSDPVRFRDLVEKGTLPAERAEACPLERRQVVRAYVALLQPHLDPDLARKVYGPGWPMLRR